MTLGREVSNCAQVASTQRPGLFRTHLFDVCCAGCARHAEDAVIVTGRLGLNAWTLWQRCMSAARVRKGSRRCHGQWPATRTHQHYCERPVCVHSGCNIPCVWTRRPGTRPLLATPGIQHLPRLPEERPLYPQRQAAGGQHDASQVHLARETPSWCETSVRVQLERRLLCCGAGVTYAHPEQFCVWRAHMALMPVFQGCTACECGTRGARAFEHMQ
jgi:hypothetical protein